jgi:hypothetical protein
MNIKHISLLSLLCIVSAQCTEKTTPKKIDIAKKAYLDCREYLSKKTTECNSELKAFEQTKQEFLQPHREKMHDGISAHKRYNEAFRHTSSWNIPALEVSRNANYFETWGHGLIVEAFDGRNNYDFLYSDKSVEEFSNQILNEPFCTDHSSYVKYMLGNRFMWEAEMQGKHQDHIDSARSKIKQIIKEQQ